MLAALALHGFAGHDGLLLSFVFEARSIREATQLAGDLRSGYPDASVLIRPRLRARLSGPRWSVALRTVPVMLCYSVVRRIERELHDTAARYAGTRFDGWRPVLAAADAEQVLRPGRWTP
jgi:hypothetical protein